MTGSNSFAHASVGEERRKGNFVCTKSAKQRTRQVNPEIIRSELSANVVSAGANVEMEWILEKFGVPTMECRRLVEVANSKYISRKASWIGGLSLIKLLIFVNMRSAPF